MDKDLETLDSLLDKIFCLGSSFAREHPHIESKKYEEYGNNYSKLKDQVIFIINKNLKVVYENTY